MHKYLVGVDLAHSIPKWFSPSVIMAVQNNMNRWYTLQRWSRFSFSILFVKNIQVMFLEKHVYTIQMIYKTKGRAVNVMNS